MRYILGLILALLFIKSCAPSEIVTEGPTADETEVAGAPEWYDERVYSDSDSLSFHGFAMASAIDSIRAIQLSEETAIENLRFEIDRHADQTRQLLSEEGDETYGTVSFIINLRNAVQGINLSNSDLTHEFETSDDGIHYVYTRASISRHQVHLLLNEYISDGSFIDRLQADL